LAGLLVVVVGHDGDVEGSAVQAGEQARGGVFADGELDPGCAAVQLGHGGGQERDVGGGDAAEPHVSCVEPADRVQLLAGGGDAGEDGRGVLAQRAPGLGQANAAGAALQQRQAGLVFERRDVAGDRRLGVAEGLGGGAERAAAGDLIEGLQMPEIHNPDGMRVTHS
jgi:hypothetical protein